MNKLFFRRIALFSVCLCIITLTACSGGNSNNGNNDTVKKENSIYIFYPDDARVVQDENMYQLKQPDSIAASIEEIMSVLAPKLDDDILTYHTYMLGENNDVGLEFVQNGETDKDYFLIVNAAVTSTLFQLKDINSIGIQMTDLAGTVLSNEIFERNSFYFYDSEVEELSGREVDLYCNAEDGAALSRVKTKIYLDPHVKIEEQVISELVALKAIPEKTTVISAVIDSGICYLELSRGFLDVLENVKNDVVIYSVVNSIISATRVDSVKIIINGETQTMYRGTVDISQPLRFNMEIVVE